VRGILRADYGMAETAAERALEHYTRAGYTPSRCFALLADVIVKRRPVDEAAIRLQELLARPDADHLARATIELTLARVEAMRCRFDRARELAASGRDLTLELGYRSVLLTEWPYVAGTTESLAGEFEAAERILRDAYSASGDDSPPAWRSALASPLADALHRLVRYDEALEFADAARDAASSSNLRAEVAWRCVRGKALARLGSVEEGEALVREALALLEQTEDETARAEALLDLAEVSLAAGRGAQARREAAEARKLFERRGYVAGAERAAAIEAEKGGSPPTGGLPGSRAVRAR
jgi:tetratricopeptide (TPR) repeat protein